MLVVQNVAASGTVESKQRSGGVEEDRRDASAHLFGFFTKETVTGKHVIGGTLV